MLFFLFAFGVLQTPVNPLKDTIFLDGRSLPKKPPPKFYFALNKPKGYVSFHILFIGALCTLRYISICIGYASSLYRPDWFLQHVIERRNLKQDKAQH